MSPSGEPESLEEAKRSPEWPEWEKAIKIELDQLTEMGTWNLVDCYVEFHPEHSLLFSNVLCSHVTSFHAFHPNLPLRNINTLRSL